VFWKIGDTWAVVYRKQRNFITYQYMSKGFQAIRATDWSRASNFSWRIDFKRYLNSDLYVCLSSTSFWTSPLEVTSSPMIGPAMAVEDRGISNIKDLGVNSGIADRRGSTLGAINRRTIQCKWITFGSISCRIIMILSRDGISYTRADEETH